MGLGVVPCTGAEPDPAIEPVVGDRLRRHHEQVLANVDRDARVHRNGECLAWRVTAERDSAGARRVEHVNGQPRHQALPRACEAALRDAYRWLLPEQFVMREVDAVALREREVGYGHDLPLDLHRRPPALDASHVARGGQLDPT